MGFYCPYCNRVKSGKRGTKAEKTGEHFIPKSIGGKREIPTCKECNNKAGASCDAFFAKVAYTYKLYNRQIVDTVGIAELTSGNKIPVSFRIKDDKQFNLISCRHAEDNTEYKSKDIESITFPVTKPLDVVSTYPGIAKMTLGATYYLLKRYGKWDSTAETIFNDLSFADVRKLFLRDNFCFGGNGKGKGMEIQSLINQDASKLLNSFEEPAIRRNYIRVESSHIGLKVTLCLYSTFFWVAKINGVNFNQGPFEEDCKLEKLSPVNPTKAANLMHYDGDTNIRILLHA